MGHPALERLLPKSGWSIYKLSRLAATRATELAEGRRPMVETKPTDKTATIALEEIKEGLVVLQDVADQFQPQEKPVKKVSAKDKSTETKDEDASEQPE
ncbi:MAG: DNA-directed RNA polymerase subunit omega [Candidatus Omnitrophota bacterium]